MNERTILESVGKHAGRSFTAVERLEGGDEAIVFRLESASVSYVLHISPLWRSRLELEWAYAVAARANESIKEAVKPIEGHGGTVFELEGCCAALFPFIPGEKLDRGDAKLRSKAARLLAEIHAALINWVPEPRPPSRPARPSIPPDVDELKDSDLDDWWNRENANGLLTGPTHGDYYRGNLICRDGQIKGIIDWHDASERPLSVELAGAAYEFCRNDEYVLDTGRVREFVEAYRAHGGPVPDREIEMLLLFMRWWIREDARLSFAELPGTENEYAWNQARMFSAMRDFRFDL